ncbi:MAG: ABC transporter permease [Lachnospiraceae bacterium]|nr:ABC transporter permease [Lachnospiraceae bacterium]
MENTSVNGKKAHEPLFHLVKRDSIKFWQSWLIRIGAVVAALIIVAIIASLMGYDPLSFYKTMWEGSFGSKRKIWKFLQSGAVLLGLAVALAPAFRMRFWNTGAEGQALIGGLAAAAVMQFATGVPSAVQIIFVIGAGVLAGAIWGFLPAVCKANWGTNETLFTLMMNYIAMQLTSFFIYSWDKSGHGNLGIINRKTKLGWLPSLGGNEYILAIIVVLLVTIGIHIYLVYLKHGYELAVVGESENTARYVGINVKKVIIRTMILSGALCGLVGVLVVSGIDHTITKDSIGGQGFTAIMVSWMAKFNPFYMIFCALLIIFLERGGSEVSTVLGLNDSFSEIVSGIIILFIIGSEFFINYRIMFNKHRREVEG